MINIHQCRHKQTYLEMGMMGNSSFGLVDTKKAAHLFFYLIRKNKNKNQINKFHSFDSNKTLNLVNSITNKQTNKTNNKANNNTKKTNHKII